VTHLAIGVDSSTQATKVEVRDLDSGNLVASARAAHPAVSPPCCEQDPEEWWAALLSCLSEVREHLSHVRALSIAAQQHGLVLVDSSGAVIRPAKLWNDTTSAAQAARLVEQIGAKAWASACGLVPVAAITISKLAWLAEHEPTALARTSKVMLPHDYLTWKLTGSHVTDRGDASGTGWWDPSRGDYRADLLGLVVDDPEAWIGRLPRVLRPSQPAGCVMDSTAHSLGLSRQAVVGPGTGDNMAAAVGLALESGDVVVSLGTSGTIYAASEHPTADASGAVAGFADANGRFLPLVCTNNATGVTDAVGRWLGVEREALADLALSVSPNSNLVMLPYLAGERTPNLPDATGSIRGLTLSTTRANLAAMAHIGVLCGLLSGADALQACGVTLTGRALLVGGGARSRAYRQLLADLWERPVTVPTAEEAVAAGAAAQAAAVLVNQQPSDVARRWSLGTGPTVRPRDFIDSRGIRRAYHDAAEAMWTSQEEIPDARG
jgi:xylulokinase